MADIFISYARGDKAAAEAVAGALAAEGFTAWWDTSLVAGESWSDTIRTELKAAKVVLVLWSRASWASRWVQAEAHAGHERDCLVAARLDEVALEPPFNIVQTADLRGFARNPACLQAILAGIKKKLGSTNPSTDQSGLPVTGEPVSLALPDKPSIAVMPFADMTGAIDQDYFTEGMLVEIVTALSAFPSLFVISHAASLSLRGDTRSHTMIARELGVRYILSGSVRKAGDRVRIAVELLDEAARTPIWTQRFDGTLEDVFALQDTVANAVASQIEPSIQAAEVRRATTRPTADPGAYDLYLRGLHEQWGKYDREHLLSAIGYFDQAIERDPNFALALVHASNAHINMYIMCVSDDPDASRQKAYDLAKRAERLQTNDAEVLAFAAYSLFQGGADMPIVDVLIARALEINPGSSVVRYNSGWIYAFACRPEAALAEFEEGLRLDPRSPWWTAMTLGQGWSLFHQRRFAEALPLIYKAIDLVQPELTRKIIASCHGHLGKYDEARAVLQGVELNAPREAVWLSLYRDMSFRAVLEEGLALADRERATI